MLFFLKPSQKVVSCHADITYWYLQIAALVYNFFITIFVSDDSIWFTMAKDLVVSSLRHKENEHASFFIILLI